MSFLHSKPKPAAKAVRLAFGVALVAAVLAGSAVTDITLRPSRANVGPENRVGVLALKWFAEMQSGKIDRTQLAADYSAQLTDTAVHGMSQYLEEHDYGAPPTRAEILKKRTLTNQTLYEVKLLFPRGDAASLLFGFNPEGKITGVSLLSMAGD